MLQNHTQSIRWCFAFSKEYIERNIENNRNNWQKNRLGKSQYDINGAAGKISAPALLSDKID